MATFPILSSGAITQYPAAGRWGQAVQTIRFIDGSEQRYLFQGRALRQWEVHLNLLNDTEIQQIEAFVEAIQGDYSSFTFLDPVSGTAIPNCRLASPSMVNQYVGPDQSSTSLGVIETYG